MKYMLMMFGDGATMMQRRRQEWVGKLHEFIDSFNAELTSAGELVEARGLADPTSAKTVRLVDGRVVVTDGPFAEAKESLAGYWVLEVADEQRAIERAGQVVVWAERVELREVADGPPEQ